MSCACPDDATMNARDAALASDPAYIRLLEAQSVWPGNYVFGTTMPVNTCQAPLWGGNRAHVGPGQVPAYNAMLSSHSRVDRRASQHRLQTELYGRAPLMRLRNFDANVDSGSRLRWGEAVHKEGARRLTETDLSRPDFLTLPEALTALPETRLGRLTRGGPDYIDAQAAQPHA